MMICIYRI